MENRAGLRVGRHLGAALAAFLGAACPANLGAQFTGPICTEVKLEILQEATLEREAFDARLVVNNNLPETALTGLRVSIFVKDSDGHAADALFFVKIATLTNTNAVDGTGVVQSSSSAEIHWLIIPSTGAGGVNPAGRRYSGRASISGMAGDTPQNLITFDDFITVRPQPSLKLEYVLPFEGFGDEPLTEGTIEPIEPFPLGVRVTNVGYGTAKDFKIDSAQPRIVENKQGLLIDFTLIGTVVGGVTIPDTLLVPFGDIAPGAAGNASWVMTTSLSGRFVEFTSTFTHAAELGGELTSLIESVTTYTLVKDMLVDVPGRDATPDFLVDTRTPRDRIESILNAGEDLAPDFILESDQSLPLPVANVASTLTGALGSASASLRLAFDSAVGANVWVHTSVPFPLGTSVRLASARCSDGKLLDLRNVWVSKHFSKAANMVSYRLHVVDLSSGDGVYDLDFDQSSLNFAPAAVTDLRAATGSEGGELVLA